MAFYELKCGATFERDEQPLFISHVATCRECIRRQLVSNQFNRAQMRAKAFEIAAGLIESMDLEKFWGEEIRDANKDSCLSEIQPFVVTKLRTIHANYAGLLPKP